MSVEEVAWLLMRVSKLEQKLSELTKYFDCAVCNVCLQPTPLNGDGFYCKECCEFFCAENTACCDDPIECVECDAEFCRGCRDALKLCQKCDSPLCNNCIGEQGNSICAQCRD